MRLSICLVLLSFLSSFQYNRSISFVNSSETFTCRCLFDRTGKSARTAYSFTYSKKPTTVGGHDYYLAKSTYFPGGQLYLRETDGKVYGLQKPGFKELLLMDFNMKEGDTLISAPTLEYTFTGSYFHERLKEQAYRFELSRNTRDFAHGCSNIAFEVTTTRGFIKLEYKCDNGRDFHCSMKPHK